MEPPLGGGGASMSAAGAAAAAAAADNSLQAGQHVRLLSWNVNGLRAALKRLNVTISHFLEGLGAGGRVRAHLRSFLHANSALPCRRPSINQPPTHRLPLSPAAPGGRHHLFPGDQAAAVRHRPRAGGGGGLVGAAPQGRGLVGSLLLQQSSAQSACCAVLQAH